MRYEETKYGFNYGALDIERNCCDKRKGWVYITLRTKKAELRLYVTKSGQMKVYDKEGNRLL